ncbi:MAG TPA: hypothetical protein VK851_12220, partial [Anaerolineales bacterium]|nr:hypothetical protein [Anaerolineales bacterium]
NCASREQRDDISPLTNHPAGAIVSCRAWGGKLPFIYCTMSDKFREQSEAFHHRVHREHGEILYLSLCALCDLCGEKS